MTLFQTVRMGQKLEILDIKNPAPGPEVSGAQAYMMFLLTGNPQPRVQEIVS